MKSSWILVGVAVATGCLLLSRDELVAPSAEDGGQYGTGPTAAQEVATDTEPAPADSVRVSAAPSAPTHAAGFWQEGIKSWTTPTFSQRYFVRSFRDVEVMDRGKNPVTGTWSNISHYGGASFDIMRAASATRDRFAFAGMADDGDVVLETWTAVPVMHSVGGATVQVLNNEGMGVKRLRKVEIHRGSLGSGLLALEFDAEARFLMVLVESQAGPVLYRFDNHAGAQPVVEADTSWLPELADMRYLQKFHHESVYGRVWQLWDGPIPTQKIAFLDYDNDGVFDGAPMVGNAAYFSAAGFDEFDDWDTLTGGL